MDSDVEEEMGCESERGHIARSRRVGASDACYGCHYGDARELVLSGRCADSWIM